MRPVTRQSRVQHAFSWRSAFGSLALGLLAAVTRSDAQATVSLTTQDCPVCTGEQVAAALGSINTSWGIRGRDVLGHVIGMTNSYDEDGPKSAPLSPVKQTICGELKQLRYFWRLSDEDWAFNIAPSEDYLPMLLAATAAGY